MPEPHPIDPYDSMSALPPSAVFRRPTFRRSALFIRLALIGVAGGVGALACGGCGLVARAFEGGAEDDRSLLVEETRGSVPISSAELDELTRAFADRYVGLLSSTCDRLKKDNPDLVQRREAQVLLADCAANVYDIASNPDPFTRMLDLIVVTTLVSQVWIDDNRVAEVFPTRQEVLVRALHHGRQEAWALAAQVLRPDQLDLLDYLLWDWRQRNRDLVRASFVRFSAFAGGRAKSAGAEVGASSGLSVVELLGVGDLFSSVGEAGRAVNEARQFSERMFYLLKREPTLLRWQAAALRDGTLATPAVGMAFADVHRLTDQIEQLPLNVKAEREAILADFDRRIDRTDESVTNLRRALSQASELVTSLEPASVALNEMLKTANVLVARFESSDGETPSQPSRPFDIREYQEALEELATTAGKMNELLASSHELLGSSEWDRRIQEVSQAADGRMRVAAEHSQSLMNQFLWRTYVALGVFSAMLVLCLVFSFMLMWRLRIVVVNAAEPPREATAGVRRETRPPIDTRDTARDTAHDTGEGKVSE